MAFNECADPGQISDIASADSNRIVGTIAASLAYNAPYLGLIKGGTFESGVSDEQTSLVQMQAAPGDSLAIPQFLCDSEMCGQTGHVDNTDTISYTVRLESFRGRGPKVCVKKGYSAFKGSYTSAEESLKKLIPQYVNADIRAQLYRRSGSKFTCASGYDFASLWTGGSETDLGVKFAPILPDSPVSFKALSYISRYMREVMLADWFASDKGMPHFRFIAGADMINKLRDDADVKNSAIALTQGGYKFGETTLQAYSFEQSPAYRGLAFGVDQRPLRGSAFGVDGELTLVDPVTKVVNAQKNTAYAKANPTWLNNAYEVGLLVADGSFERQVPQRYIGEGSFKFSPQLFMGELDWHYTIDNDCNQWGDYGWHKYQIIRAYKPQRPHFVVPILYKRPVTDLGLAPEEPEVTSSYTGADAFVDLTCVSPE